MVMVISVPAWAGRSSSGRLGRTCRRPRSACDDVDDDGCGVGERVVDRGAAPGLLDETTQRLLVRVALDVEGDPDLLVPVADRAVGQAEDPEQIHVALDGRADLGQFHPPGRCDVGDARGEAGGDRVQQVLDRCGSVIGTHEDDRVVELEDAVALVRHFLHGPVEVRRRRAAVRPGHPGVARPELELRDLRLAADGVERREQRGGVDSVEGATVGGEGHDCSLGRCRCSGYCLSSFAVLSFAVLSFAVLSFAVLSFAATAAATPESRQTTAEPSSTTRPSWFVIRVARVVTGLSSRTPVTVASAVRTSPGRTGARNCHETCRKTLPGPGSCSATRALSRPLVTPPCTTIPPKRLRSATSTS